jgi:hypothetical protein
MLNITTDGVEDLLKGLSGMQRQIPYAAANGINATGRKVKVGLQVVMNIAFDRPTPFVINSLQLTPARAPRAIEASVWFKDPPNIGTKGHFLLPQVVGGARPLKPFEMGVGGQFVMPSKYAALDQYGNLGRGQITKLLSLSGGFRESGFTANTRSRAKRKQYFRLLTQQGKLPPGIYERIVKEEAGGRAARFLLARAITKKRKIKGGLKALSDRTKDLYPRGLKPMVLFTAAGKAPRYNKRFDFYGEAERIVQDNIYGDMSEAIAAEIQRELAYRTSHGSG